MTENYRGCYEYLSAQFEQVGGYDFYRELFPDNELYGVKYDDFSHPSAVYLYQGEDERLPEGFAVALWTPSLALRMLLRFGRRFFS